ncbi:MAG: tetratricopeptide repeat protein, partial [Phycisphaerales bacterium]
KAKEHQRKGEKLFSESAEAYFNRSMMAGTVNKTLEWLNKAIDFEPGHYDSREARALAYYALRKYDEMEIDAYVMIGNQSNNSKGYALRAIARREKAIRQSEKELFGEAIRDHNRAITLSSAEAELYDQRRRTHLQMGNYEQVLSDARKCVELEPEEGIYRFHVFCALVASGRYDEAKAKYDTIIKSGLMSKGHLDLSAAKYVSDTLDSGLSWYPPQRRPEGPAFLEMHESAEIYEQLAKKAERVVAEGFHATWSPDGTELVYSCGIHGFSGIEIINLEAGKTRLLTVPGFDQAWSPDGQYIAYVRVRQALLLAHLTTEYGAEIAPHAQREVWIIRADGTEDSRLLARGGFPCWSRDSKRVFYHSPKDMTLYSISIEGSAEPTPVISCPSYYPVVSPDEKYVAYWYGQLRIVQLSTKSVVVSWTVPLIFPGASLNWSPNGRELSIGGGSSGHGLWIYNLDTRTASRVLSGLIGWSSWSCPHISQFAFQRTYGRLHREIWVADLDPNVSTTEALGPGRTIEQHCQEIISLYTRRIETDPEDAENYLSRAEYYVYLQDDKKAFADLEKYAEINPSQAAAGYNSLGWGLVRRVQEMVSPEIAVELYRKANEIQPEVWDYLFGLGMAHYRAGQWEEAISTLTRASELPGGENSRNFFLLAMAHWQLGDKATAANWYNKVIELAQKSNIDILSLPLRGSTLYSFYLEAAELMGIKIKELKRKAPLMGEQVLPVTARADSSHLDMTVEHIVDGTGLADGDVDGLLEHDENPENMWLSEGGRGRSWVEFDLGGVYELGSILVWNYNERANTQRGVRSADISVWAPEAGWQKTFDDFNFAEAEGSFDYDEPILVRFDGVKAQKARFEDLISLGDEEYIGLSEVRFFERRGSEAIKPYPADGADIGVPIEAKLSWTPGMGVKAHKVYFGADADSLKYIGRFEIGESSEMKLPGLEKRQRYWWRIDAEKSDGSMIKGKVWSFSTGHMVAWWKFDQIEGRIAVDSSGSGLDGKLVGNARIISDPQRGNVLSLNGDGDHVIVPDGGDWLNGLEGLTVCLWVKSNVTATDKGFIIFEEASGGDNRSMRYDAAGGRLGGGTNLIKCAITSDADEGPPENPGRQQLESSDNTQTTEWQHIAMTWS